MLIVSFRNAMTSQDVVDFVSQRMSHGVEKLSTICEDVCISNYSFG